MGGKSRKSGGVSSKLIAQLKAKVMGGDVKKKSCGKKPKKSETMFDRAGADGAE